MPTQKITKFKGTLWFQCLWTGVLLEKCYAYPDHDKFMRRKNGGSFADRACALAWLSSAREGGKISQKKFNDIVSFISQEVSGKEMLEAPSMDPDKPYFGYRDEYPWLYPEEDEFLTIKTVMDWKAEDSERR